MLRKYNETDKPEGFEQEHSDYLVKLRDSGETNMFGATPYLQRVFDLDRNTARRYLSWWMETFKDES